MFGNKQSGATVSSRTLINWANELQTATDPNNSRGREKKEIK